MHIPAWFRFLAPTSRKNRGRPAKIRRRQSAALALEQLEDRAVPSAVSWTGSGGNLLWANAANWSSSAVPVAGDDVQIDASGVTISQPASATVQSLSLVNGTLEGGSLTVTGSFAWSAGSLRNGRLTASVTAISGGTLDGETLVSGQSANLTGNLYLYNGAKFDNEGSLTLGNTGNMQRGGGDTSNVLLLNNGTINKPIGSGEAHLLLPIDSAGPITVSAGDLSLGDYFGTSPSTSTYHAAVTGAAGTLVNLTGGAAGTSTFLGALDVDRVDFGDASTYSFEGSYRSNWSRTRGSVSINGPVQEIGALFVYGGSTDFSPATGGPATVSFSSLDLYGTLTGSDDFAVTSTFNWGSGMLGGPGARMTIGVNATAVLAGGNSGLSSRFLNLDTRELDNLGTTSVRALPEGVIDAGLIQLLLSGGSVINNYNTFYFNQTPGPGGLDIAGLATGEAFNNLSGGNFMVVSGTGSGRIRVPFNNSGTVDVGTDTGLALDAGGISSGKFTVAAGSSLRFLGATTLTVTSRLDSAGDVAFADRSAHMSYNGPAVVQGTYNVSATGSTTLENLDSVAADFSGALLGVGQALSVTGGGNGADFHGTPLTLQNLKVEGALHAGDIQVGRFYNAALPSLFEWDYFGPISGPGTVLTVAADAQAILTGGHAISPNTVFLDGRRLDNNGTLTMQGVGGNLFLRGGAIINNYGTFQTAGNMDGFFVRGSESGEAFNNYHSYVEAGSGGTVFLIPYNNTGTVVVPSDGELLLQGGGASTGSFTAAADTFIRFTGSYTLAPSVTVAADVLELGGEFTLPFAGGPTDVRFAQISANSVFLTASLTIAPSSSFHTVPGASFRLIDNTGDTAVNRNFEELPEGTIFPLADGTQCQMSYIGGDGNDVVVTIISVPMPPIADPSLVTTASYSIVNGEVRLTDSAILADGFSATGTITFTLHAPDSTTQTLPAVTVSGNGTYVTPIFVVATQVGTYWWTASYSGDSNNNPASDPGTSVQELITTVANPTGGLSIGFWTNKNGQALETLTDFSALTALSLRTSTGANQDFTATGGAALATDKASLAAWLKSATATNMAYMLSAQLAATQLDVLHGYVDANGYVDVNLISAAFRSSFNTSNDLIAALNSQGGLTDAYGIVKIQSLMNAANSVLSTTPGSNTVAASALRSYEEALKDVLDAINNNQLIVLV